MWNPSALKSFVLIPCGGWSLRCATPAEVADDGVSGVDALAVGVAYLSQQPFGVESFWQCNALLQSIRQLQSHGCGNCKKIYWGQVEFSQGKKKDFVDLDSESTDPSDEMTSFFGLFRWLTPGRWNISKG